MVKESVPRIFDVLGGVAYVQYELDKGAHLVALDTKTGATLWDVLVPRTNEGSIADRMSISEKRIYLPHWTWLDVFERDRGKLVGTIGRW